MTDTARLRCCVPDCPNGIRVDIRQLANLLASGRRCPGHHEHEQAK